MAHTFDIIFAFSRDVEVITYNILQDGKLCQLNTLFFSFLMKKMLPESDFSGHRSHVRGGEKGGPSF